MGKLRASLSDESVQSSACLSKTLYTGYLNLERPKAPHACRSESIQTCADAPVRSHLPPAASSRNGHCRRHVGQHSCASQRYIAALYIIFPFWRSRADRVLTLEMGFGLQLFWITWSRPGGGTRPHVRLAHGRVYSYGIASEQKRQKCLASVFP